MAPISLILVLMSLLQIQGSSEFVRTIKYPMPHYNEVAPCACDLTEKRCDAHCCCDQDCPTDYHGNWTCIPGLPGGIDPGKNVDHNCSYEPRLFESDWNSLLCIFKSRSSYLGLFYEEPTMVSFSMEEASTSPYGSYKKPWSPSEPFRQNYKHGHPVRVVYNDTDGVFGYLNLPSDKCIWGPVAFLVDSQSNCRKTLNEEICQKNTMLDYQMYLMPLPKGMKVGNVAKVLSKYNSNQIVPLRASYYSALQPELYLSNVAQKKRKRDRASSSGDTVQNLLKSLDRSRKEDPSIFRGISNEQCTKIELFSNEDQYQEAQVHLEDSMCINAVLEVSYMIYWAGDEIAKMDVNVLLGNLSLSQPDLNQLLPAREYQELQQKFTAKFVHIYKGETTSGNPGYEPGRPLLAARNDSINGLVEVMSPQIWSTHETSRCMFTPLQRINFLQDSHSGCLLELKKNNLTDCENLTGNLRQIHARLVDPMSLISAGGTFSNNGSFVKTIFEDFSVAIASNHSCHVPSHMHVEITYSNSSNIYRINGVKVNYFAENWSWTCSHKGPCQTKHFQLQSTVQFIEVPVIWHHQNTSKFWILQRLDLCNGDKCWAEIFYPFTHSEKGSRIAYVTMCALTLIPGALLVLWMTKDHW